MPMPNEILPFDLSWVVFPGGSSCSNLYQSLYLLSSSASILPPRIAFSAPRDVLVTAAVDESLTPHPKDVNTVILAILQLGSLPVLTGRTSVDPRKCDDPGRPCQVRMMVSI